MQVRQVIAAALLAATAVGAMSQEVDPSENLQGRSLAAAAAKAENTGRARAAVVAETRNLQANGQLQGVGERAEAAPVAVVPNTQLATSRTRADVKAELAQWRRSHKLVVGDLG